tara:strand:+ start:441 stop:872 length:432 start_codon:yes stop_codon:yes gene_type:complete
MNNWEQRQQLQVNAYIDKLTTDYAIHEVTTDRQLKNGTRMFKYGDEIFATYRSGMVRKIIRTQRLKLYSCYQLNLTRQRETDYMWLEEDGLTVRTYKGTVRVPIKQELARLVYLENYLIKNRGMEKGVKEFIIVNGVKYKRYE